MHDILGPAELWAIRGGQLVEIYPAGSDVRALIQGRADLVAIGSSLLASATSEERGLTKAEIAMDDAITQKIAELHRREKRVKAESRARSGNTGLVDVKVLGVKKRVRLLAN